MSDTFDPYYTWLGIPPDEQPADHYQLLGVKSLEGNLDAIENAADRRMAHLRTLQSGKHGTHSQKLLNEISAARVTLLNPEKKAEYDQSLRQKLKPKAAPKAAPLLVADPLSEDNIPRPDFLTEPAIERTAAKKPSAGRQQAIIGAAVGGGAFVLLLIAFLVWQAGGPKDETPDALAAGNDRAAGQPDEPPKPPPPDETPVSPPVVPEVPEVPPESALSLADVPWTNVLDHVNLARDAENPKAWTQDSGAVTVAARGVEKIVLPVHVDGAYDLQIELTQSAPDGPIAVGIPVGGRQCNLFLGLKRGKSGLSRIGDTIVYGPKSRPMSTDGRHRIDVMVRLDDNVATINTLLDGEPLVRWKGSPSELSSPEGWSFEKPNRVGLATRKNTVSFHAVRIRSAQETPLVVVDPVQPPVEELPVETPIVEPPKPVKHPVPSPAEQQQILVQVEEVYELGKAQTAEQKIKAANELITLAADPSGIPAERFVMLRKAMDLAREAGDAGLMLGAVDAMGAANIDINLLDAKANVFAQFAENAKDPVVIKSLMENTPLLVEQAIAEKRYDVAYNAVKAAHTVSSRPAGLPYRKDLADKLKEVAKLKDQLAAIEQAEASLQTNPDDPAANLLVGRWYCFDKGDWDRGLPYLAKGSDAELKQAATQEAKQPTDPDAMVALGDIWWGMAEKAPEDQKKNLYSRAAHWYGQTEGKLTALTKLKVQKRLEELAKIDPKMAAKVGVVEPGSLLPIGRWIDLLQFVPEGNGWQREGEALVLRDVKSSEKAFPVVFKGDYDLQVDYTRQSGTYGISIHLPIGNRLCELGLDYKVTSEQVASGQSTSGLGVGGERWYRNSTSKKHAWELEKKYSIVSQVRMTDENVSINVLRDGQPLVEWSGNPTALDAFRPSERGRINTPRIRFYKTEGTLHVARTRLVSGNGGLLDAEGKIPIEVQLAETGKPAVPFDPLGFYPSGGLRKNAKGAWELREREHILRVGKPVEGPWILDFDFILPSDERGLSVSFANEGRLTLTMLANDHCAMRWRGSEGYLARLPREAARLLQPGKAFHARLMVGDGGAALLINNVPALQANDKRINPNGSITITGRPAIIANPKLTVKSATRGRPTKSRATKDD